MGPGLSICPELPAKHGRISAISIRMKRDCKKAEPTIPAAINRELEEVVRENPLERFGL